VSFKAVYVRYVLFFAVCFKSFNFVIHAVLHITNFTSHGILIISICVVLILQPFHFNRCSVYFDLFFDVAFYKHY
jgi:hypothetical protein